MAAQLMTTKGFLALALYLWIRPATNSLPVPVSPVMRTLLSAAATCLRKLIIPSMAGFLVIILSSLQGPATIGSGVASNFTDRPERLRLILAAKSSQARGILR